MKVFSIPNYSVSAQNGQSVSANRFSRQPAFGVAADVVSLSKAALSKKPQKWFEEFGIWFTEDVVRILSSEMAPTLKTDFVEIFKDIRLVSDAVVKKARELDMNIPEKAEKPIVWINLEKGKEYGHASTEIYLGWCDIQRNEKDKLQLMCYILPNECLAECIAGRKLSEAEMFFWDLINGFRDVMPSCFMGYDIPPELYVRHGKLPR